MRHGFCTLSLLMIYFTSFYIQQPGSSVKWRSTKELQKIIAKRTNTACNRVNHKMFVVFTKLSSAHLLNSKDFIPDTWMWKSGLTPRNPFLGIHKWDFRCSAEVAYGWRGMAGWHTHPTPRHPSPSLTSLLFTRPTPAPPTDSGGRRPPMDGWERTWLLTAFSCSQSPNL